MNANRILRLRISLAMLLCVPLFVAGQAQAPRVRWSQSSAVSLKPEQTFALLSASPADKAQLAKLIQHDFCGASRTGSCKDATKSVRAALFGVSMGSSAIVVQGGWGSDFCAPTGNCKFLLLGKHGAVYETLLKESALSFEIWLETKAKRPEIFLASHMSAYDTELQDYIVCGDRPTKVATYNAHFADPSKDSPNDFPWPKIKLVTSYPAPCGLLK